MKKFLIGLIALSTMAAFAQESSSLMQMKQVLSGKGVNTDAVIIYKDGAKIFEFYGREYDASKKHLSWSMAKSIAGILIGQAISEGKISLNDRIDKYFPDFKTDATVENVLNMSSGLKFKEEYSGIPVDSDATKMLYLIGPKASFAQYVNSLPVKNEAIPGKHFYYSSGDTNLLMEILKKVSQTQEEYNQYPWKKLFNPLGIKDATFEQDSSGTFVGSSYVYLSPDDFLKIGQLLMQNGVWNGTQIIPKDYLTLMKEVAPGVNEHALEGTSQTRSYSSQITTNLPIEGRGLPSEYMDLPQDALLMIGHQGQLVVASPSQKLVIVRLAMDKGTSFDRKLFFNLVSKIIREKGLNLVTAGDNGQNSNTPLPASNKKKGKTKMVDYLKIPHLIRAMAAKEYCSCMLVIGRSKEACREDLKVSLPILPKLKISKDKKYVTASLGTGLLGKISRAEFKSKELGCTLVESK
ncbi:MAG: serine hydrolase domain-containing protein [Bacteriovoracaceae bacterium]